MPKKNLPQPKRNALSSLLGFTWPKLHKEKKWLVDFFAFDPAQMKNRRKKYYIADSLKPKEKNARAAEIIKIVTDKLQKGWNPWVSEGDSRGFTPIATVLDRYLEYGVSGQGGLVAPSS